MIRPVALLLAAVLLLVGGASAWRLQEPDPPRAAVLAVPAPQGAAVFRGKGCASCHDGPESTALVRGAFPSLADAAAWAGDRRAGLSAEAYLEESIREPAAFRSPAFSGESGVAAMPALGLDEAEVDAVVSYLLGG